MGQTLSEVLKEGQESLLNAGIQDAKVDAWYLFEMAFRVSKVEFLMNHEKMAEDSLCMCYKDMIQKRMRHIPLQHITGTQEFMGLEFLVDENVLIPRQDTECLVELVLQYAEHKSVLDVCTGSGCIIISLDKLNDLKKATALDISEKALEVARKNAKRLDSNVSFLQSDLFTQIHEKYDIIVSNPPYIPTQVIDTLMDEVVKHEPMLALDGKDDGLFFYRKIVAESKDYLNKNGMLFFEIGHDQGKAVSDMMIEQGFHNVTVKQDLAGLDRIVYGALG